MLLDIQVNNDDADTSQSEPPITKMEITTKLLVADGDIAVSYTHLTLPTSG